MKFIVGIIVALVLVTGASAAGEPTSVVYTEPAASASGPTTNAIPPGFACAVKGFAVNKVGNRLDADFRNICNKPAVKLFSFSCLIRKPPNQANELQYGCATNQCFACSNLLIRNFYARCNFLPSPQQWYVEGFGIVTFTNGTHTSPVVEGPKSIHYCG